MSRTIKFLNPTVPLVGCQHRLESGVNFPRNPSVNKKLAVPSKGWQRQNIDNAQRLMLISAASGTDFRHLIGRNVAPISTIFTGPAI